MRLGLGLGIEIGSVVGNRGGAARREWTGQRRGQEAKGRRGGSREVDGRLKDTKHYKLKEPTGKCTELHKPKLKPPR
jgi:hypothetical protein